MDKHPPNIPEPPGPAWLVLAGRRIVLRSPFKIGRSSRCEFRIDDRRASREHAILTHDAASERWILADLGSTNGTSLDAVRLNRPVTLRDGAEITIGDHHFTFRQLASPGAADFTVTDARTMLDVRISDCWLLLADVKGSTRLSRELEQDVLSGKLRTWVEECEALVTASGGVVDAYMGDGFLAFWRDERCEMERLAEVLRTFATLESRSGLEFRILLHFGSVQSGGAVSSGREKLAGPDINFVFKAEKSVGGLDRRVSLSEPAAGKLGSLLDLEELPAVAVAGFPGEHRFFGLPAR